MVKDNNKESNKNEAVLFVGLHYDVDEESDLIRYCKNGISVAHYKFENNIISALKEEFSVSILTSLPVGSYPFMSSKIIFRTRKYNQYNEIGYINLPYIKEWIRKKKTYKFIKKWIDETKEKNKTIIVYDSYLPFISAALDIAEKREVKVLVIIPDLPGELSIENEKYDIFLRYYLKFKAKAFYKTINKVDGLIVLTKQMIDLLQFTRKPSMVLECIVEERVVYKKKTTSKKIIMYAGELSKSVGIDTLLNAFNYIDDCNYELWICGRGEYEKKVEAVAKQNQRIRYFGFVNSSQMLKIEKEVDIYINPRNNDNIYTKYSFPSKNAEYLVTGKPLIGYKLDGIPNEYDNYIIYPEDDTVEGLVKCIRKVIKDEETSEIRSYMQKEFMKTKSVQAQAKRLKNFIGGLRC